MSTVFEGVIKVELDTQLKRAYTRQAKVNTEIKRIRAVIEEEADGRSVKGLYHKAILKIAYDSEGIKVADIKKHHPELIAVLQHLIKTKHTGQSYTYIKKYKIKV